MSSNDANANGGASSPKVDGRVTPNLQSKSGEGKMQGKKSIGGPEDAKLSGAELKKKAKEEKAARRAKEKQEKQGDTQIPVSANAQALEEGISTTTSSAKKPSTPTTKQQHKRKGSTSTNAPKQLPVRTVEAQSAAAAPPSKEKSKRVAFFNHLYAGSRRTTVAGAGKDVHPAILSLGVQISSYTICGSNARCVGMLLAFKKVCRPTTVPT